MIDAYPTGTVLYLGTEELEKLGLDGVLKAGDECKITATGRVVSVSESETETDSTCSATIQIEEMTLVPEEPQMEDYAGDVAALAENRSLGRAKASTVMHSTYRGRFGPPKPGDGDGT